MNYFVTNEFADHLAGIEHAQLKRLAVFKQFAATKSYLVNFAYNRFLDRALRYNQIDSADFINMWDYLQGINSESLQAGDYEVRASALLASDEQVVNHVNDVLTVSNGRFTTKKIHLMGNPRFEDQVNYVEVFDSLGNPARTDYYDLRGFKSMTDYFGQHGGVARELNYNLAGCVTVESLYQRNDSGNITSTQWIVSDEQGHPRRSFNQRVELQTYFLDQLNAESGEDNVFVSDRANFTDPALLAMQTKRRLYIYWHSTFVPDGQDPLTTKPFDTLLDEINAANKIDGLLAPTKSEVMDLQQVIDNQIPVYQVNNTIIEAPTDLPAFKTRNKYEIVSVGRMAPEKGFMRGIEIFEKVHARLPEVRWHIYGYDDGKTRKALQEAINKWGLQSAIKLHPYQQDITSVYKTAQLYWVTSIYEGIGIAQLEAMSYQLPVIAFDITYGPAETITDNVSGHVVVNGDLRNFARQTVATLKNQFKLEKMGRKAQERALEFSAEQMWQQWEEVFGKGEQR